MFGKQFPACGLFARHVNGLKAVGVELDLSSPDLRPAIVCDDVENAEFSGWHVSTNLNSEAVVRLKSVRHGRISGFKPWAGAKKSLDVEGDSAEISAE